MKEMELGRTIGIHGAHGGSNGVRYDLPTELAMPVASSNALVCATSGDRFKSVSANKYILYYEHSSTVCWCTS